jgi:hypothetical protein
MTNLGCGAGKHTLTVNAHTSTDAQTGFVDSTSVECTCPTAPPAKQKRKLPKRSRPDTIAAAAPAVHPRLMPLYWKCPWSIRIAAGFSASTARAQGLRV